LSYGLGDEWNKIKDSYNDIPKVYKNTNMLISFFQDLKWRKQILSKIPKLIKNKKHLKILDAGAGTGIMTDILSKEVNADFLLFDYSIPMLENASNHEKVQGVFEAMPFRENSFDCIIMGFSFHASADMVKTINELSRIDKEWIAIVGFGKSSIKNKDALSGIYLHYLIPLFALFTAGKKSKNFYNIYSIYKKLPNNKKILNLWSKKFNKYYFNEKAFGTIIQFIGKKVIN
jgi:demethylmenaquinone methyltransferase/2-methoxy-6-polyprenyl-1,4-benzoquinol methylase